MGKEISITVENLLTIEKRHVNVYHHATRSAHMIGCESSVTRPLNTDIEGDYLHVSVVSGPGNMENRSVVSLPSWVDFEFLSAKGSVSVAHASGRTLVKIPPGLPGWQLKLTRTTESNALEKGSVIITDGQTDNV